MIHMRYTWEKKRELRDDDVVQALKQCLQWTPRRRLAYVLSFPLEDLGGCTFVMALLQTAPLTMCKSLQWLLDAGVCRPMGVVDFFPLQRRGTWTFRESSRAPVYITPRYTPLFSCLFIKYDLEMAILLCNRGACPTFFGAVSQNIRDQIDHVWFELVVTSFYRAWVNWLAWDKRPSRRRWCRIAYSL